MLERLITPAVITGGPELSSFPHNFGYVSGFGRKATRLKGSEDLIALGRLVTLLGECISERKRRLYPDLPDVVLPALGQAIERQIPEIKDVISPSPITIKLNGLRAKLPFDEYAQRVRQIEYNGSHLEDIASVSRSVLKDQILVKIEPIFRAMSERIE
jgi:methyl coenzyme M reductase subunit C-like uncharacterized protein (methanogenesis marker protein 7)